MTKYTIQKGQQGEKNLFIEGVQSVCPFVPAVPFQGNMGQVQLMRLPCTNLCPHASVKDDKVYSITCGGSEQSFALDENVPNDNGKLLHIL